MQNLGGSRLYWQVQKKRDKTVNLTGQLLEAKPRKLLPARLFKIKQITRLDV